jgi:hypothetical protein
VAKRREASSFWRRVQAPGRTASCILAWVFACIVGAGTPARAQTISSRSWSTLEPGVRLLTGRTTSPTTRFWALEVALCTDYVHVASTGASSARRTTSAWGNAAGVIAAVNGDFFLTSTSTPVVYGQAVGGGRPWPVAQTGEGADYTGSWYYRRYGWIAFGPNWVEFSHTAAVRRAGGTSEGFAPGRAQTGEIPSGTIALVSGFPELVTEGTRVTCSSPTATGCFPDRSDMRARHPRSAMGLSRDRRTFWLVVVDGRSTVSAGMYGTELAKLMSDLGAWQAFNLDGGGSSTLWTSRDGIVNAPSDGSPRAVANHWGIFGGSGTGRARAAGSCTPLPTPMDAGTALDAGSAFDAGARDAGSVLDAGARDAGSVLDAGWRDATAGDAAALDAAALDASDQDAARVDPSALDAAALDGSSDGGVSTEPRRDGALTSGCSCRVSSQRSDRGPARAAWSLTCALAGLAWLRSARRRAPRAVSGRRVFLCRVFLRRVS